MKISCRDYIIRGVFLLCLTEWYLGEMLGKYKQAKNCWRNINTGWFLWNFQRCYDSFIASIDREARVSDTETNVITHKDRPTSSLPLWFIIARNSIIRNIDLKITFKPCFVQCKNSILCFSRKTDISISLFLQLQLFICANFRKKNCWRNLYNRRIFYCFLHYFVSSVSHLINVAKFAAIDLTNYCS